jgi:hypothetical protein
MSFIQRFFLAIMPRSIGQDMEKHSRLWMMQCQLCQHEISIWDLGGIRYKATGNPRSYRRCLKCGKRTWQKCYKKETAV